MSFTSSAQDTSDDTSSSPAATRSDDRSVPASGNRSRKQKRKTKNRITFRHREIDCAICQSGWRSSQKISKTKKCQHQGAHPQTLLRIQVRNVLLKWYPGSTVLKTHFPKNRNCEICKRTKITRAPCRERNGDAVLRAENFGDLITADHKVLNEGGGWRDNHRYAVVVQDSATQWIQSYPLKSKTSQVTERSLRKLLEVSEKPKVTYTDNSLEFCQSL